jgi:hypothetical protein
MTARLLLADPHRYIAHPHLAALRDGTWVMVANRAPRRAVTMHPPQDPEFVNIVMRSTDEGETWSPPQPVPGFGVTGTECAGLTPLPNGALLLNQWRFHWYPLDAPPEGPPDPLLATPAQLRQGLVGSSELDSTAAAQGSAEHWMPWLRGGGQTLISRSDDSGRRFVPISEIDVRPYSGGYGMRGGAVLDDGEILLPLSDIPHYRRIFLVRSRDAGLHWTVPEAVAQQDGCEFEEPATHVRRDGSLLMLLRENVSRTLYAIHSQDRGHTWTQPAPTGIAAYPAHLLRLADGRLAAITGRREPPCGILAYISDDEGVSWDVDHPAVVLALPHRDAGYPAAALCADGSVFAVWYHRDADGVTGLYGKRLKL